VEEAFLRKWKGIGDDLSASAERFGKGRIVLSPKHKQHRPSEDHSMDSSVNGEGIDSGEFGEGSNSTAIVHFKQPELNPQLTGHEQEKVRGRRDKDSNSSTNVESIKNIS
jgi:hypothetical protein